MKEEEELEEVEREKEEEVKERRGVERIKKRKLVKGDEGVRRHKGRYPALRCHKGRKSVRQLITTGVMKGGERRKEENPATADSHRVFIFHLRGGDRVKRRHHLREEM